MTMTKREIMRRAHELARFMTGDYSARMVLALRQAWREAKAAVKYEVVSPSEIVVRDAGAVARLRLRRWTKYGKDRLYVADVRPRYERTWGYLDLVTGRFVWEVPYTNPTLFSTVEAAVKHYARRAA